MTFAIFFPLKSISRWKKLDKKIFNFIKPLLLAIMWKFVFPQNQLTGKNIICRKLYSRD